MSFGFGIKIVFEVIAVMLVLYGVINEEKIIAFEDEMFAIIKFCIKKYILKSNKKNVKRSRTAQKKVVRTKENIRPVVSHKATIKQFPVKQVGVRNNVA